MGWFVEAQISAQRSVLVLSTQCLAIVPLMTSVVGPDRTFLHTHVILPFHRLSPLGVGDAGPLYSNPKPSMGRDKRR